MKVEIKKDGFIYIIAETPEEAFALNYLTAKPSNPIPVVVDCSILNDTSA